MLNKAASKWTIAFLSGFILTVGIFLWFEVPQMFKRKICPAAQAEEIQKVVNKVQEMQGKTGYEMIYFEVKPCVEEIKYQNENLSVQYKTANASVNYPMNFDWKDSSGSDLDMKKPKPGSYLVKVFEDHVEVVG